MTSLQDKGRTGHHVPHSLEQIRVISATGSTSDDETTDLLIQLYLLIFSLLIYCVV